LEIVQYLIETCHVDKEAKDNKGRSAYDIATKYKKSEVVQYLLNVREDSATMKIRKQEEMIQKQEAMIQQQNEMMQNQGKTIQQLSQKVERLEKVVENDSRGGGTILAKAEEVFKKAISGVKSLKRDVQGQGEVTTIYYEVSNHNMRLLTLEERVGYLENSATKENVPLPPKKWKW
jgi:uncharacterized protein (DUF3084 family)